MVYLINIFQNLKKKKRIIYTIIIININTAYIQIFY